jgi:hypothetical protein
MQTSQIDKRDHKIKCQYGMGDYARWYSKNTEAPVSDKIFRQVLKDFLKMNQEITSATGHSFKLPEQCGKIEIRKIKRELEVDENGKIINKLPINWQATKKLWAENPKAKDKKIKIRYTNEHTDGYVFHPYYIKRHANYKNKQYYKMQVNREMARNMYNSIMSGKLDAFLLFDNK